MAPEVGDASSYHGPAVTDTQPRTRALPVLDVLDVAASAPSVAPREPRPPADERLTEYLPVTRALPRFHVWTLGCQMNRSDSEEMAGRLLAAGCEEAGSMEAADLVVINTCAIREGAEQKVIGRPGPARAAQGRQPGDAGRADRLFRPRAGSSRAPASLPGRRCLPAPGRGARTGRSTRAGLGAGPDRRSRRGRRARRGRGNRPGRCDDARRTDPRRRRRSPARHPRRGGGAGERRPRECDQRLAADHLRLRQDLHLLHRAVQPRPGAEPAVRRDRRGSPSPGGRRLPRGHAPRPERQLVRPRPGDRSLASPTSTRTAGPAASSTSKAGRTWPSSSARSTASGSRGFASSRRIRGTSPTG